MIGVVLTSLQSNAEIAARGVWHIPENASLANFQDVMANTPLPRYLLNSFLVTIPATFFSVLGGVLLGYVFSQFRFPFAELLFLVVIAGMFFPPQAMLIPLFRLFNAPIEIAGFQVLPALYDTIYPMIIIHVAPGPGHHDAADAQLHERAAVRPARGGHRRRRRRMVGAVPGRSCRCRCRPWPCWRRCSSPGSGTTSCGRSC